MNIRHKGGWRMSSDTSTIGLWHSGGNCVMLVLRLFFYGLLQACTTEQLNKSWQMNTTAKHFPGVDPLLAASKKTPGRFDENAEGVLFCMHWSVSWLPESLLCSITAHPQHLEDTWESWWCDEAVFSSPLLWGFVFNIWSSFSFRSFFSSFCDEWNRCQCRYNQLLLLAWIVIYFATSGDRTNCRNPLPEYYFFRVIQLTTRKQLRRLDAIHLVTAYLGMFCIPVHVRFHFSSDKFWFLREFCTKMMQIAFGPIHTGCRISRKKKKWSVHTKCDQHQRICLRKSAKATGVNWVKDLRLFVSRWENSFPFPSSTEDKKSDRCSQKTTKKPIRELKRDKFAKKGLDKMLLRKKL